MMMHVVFPATTPPVRHWHATIRMMNIWYFVDDTGSTTHVVLSKVDMKQFGS